MRHPLLNVALLAAVIWLAVALIKTENQRYALLLNMCPDPVLHVDQACLARIETRTGWWAHLYYGLTN